MANEALDEAERFVLAAAVKAARLASGMSVETAAAKASTGNDKKRMSPVTWGRVEAGENVRDDTYFRVFRTLGWDWASFTDVAAGKPPRPAPESNVVVLETPGGRRIADHREPASQVQLFVSARAKLESGEALTSEESAALRQALENSEISTLEERLGELSREDLLRVSRFVDELLELADLPGVRLPVGNPDGSPPDFEAVGPVDYDWDSLAAFQTRSVPQAQQVEHIDPVAEDGEAGED